MAGIDDFIKTNPQFKGEDPAEVAEYVFSTQFQGKNVDRSEFDEYFLGKQQGMIGRAWDTVKGAVVGDAEFPDMGNLQTIGAGNSMGVGMASVFGSDEDMARAAVENNPGSTLSQDANGNPMLTTAEGQRAYINKPGLDAEDATRFIGKAASFIPAGKLTSIAGKGLGKLAGIGTAGVTAGATDIAMQKAAGREDIDEGQVVLTSILGAGAETLAIPAAAAIKAMKNSGVWSRLTPEQKGQELASQLGIKIGNPQTLHRMGQLDEAGGELVSPEAVMTDSVFGYRMTRGQAMPANTAKERAKKFNQLSEEERLRSTGHGQQFRDMDDLNKQRTESNIDALAQRLNPDRAAGGNANAAAGNVSDLLKTAERQSKGSVDAAYSKAREHSLDFDESWVKGLADNVRKRLDDSDVEIDDLTPATRNALEGLAKEGRTSIGGIERRRRLLARSYDKAANNEDRRAIQLAKDALDSEIDSAIEAGLYAGDAQAIAAIKDARALNTRYMRKFRNKSEAGKIVQKLLRDDVTPESVVQYMIGVNGISKAGAANIAQQYGKAVGKETEAWNSLREMAFLTIAKRPTTEAKGHQALISTLKTGLDGKGESLMKELFTARERNQMRRFVDALEQITPDGMAARSSGTAERLMRFVNPNVPFIGWMKELADSSKARAAFDLTAPAKRLPGVETTGVLAETQRRLSD